MPEIATSEEEEEELATAADPISVCMRHHQLLILTISQQDEDAIFNIDSDVFLRILDWNMGSVEFEMGRNRFCLETKKEN